MRVFDIGLKQCPQLAYSPDSATLATSCFPKYATRVVLLWPLSGDEQPQERIFRPGTYAPLHTFDELITGVIGARPRFAVPKKASHRSVRLGAGKARVADVFALLVCYSQPVMHTPKVYAVYVAKVSEPHRHPPIEWVFDYHPAGTPRPCLSADGSRVAVLAGPAVRVWQVETGEVLGTVKNKRLLPANFAFSTDGRYLCVLFQDSVSLYDTTSWTVAKTYSWNVGKLLSLAFSPDGTTAAVGSDKGKVVVFDLE